MITTYKDLENAVVEFHEGLTSDDSFIKLFFAHKAQGYRHEFTFQNGKRYAVWVDAKGLVQTQLL